MFRKLPFSITSPVTRTLPLALCAAALMAGTSTVATAQNLPRGASILNRPKPELDPLGIRAGGFLIFPKIEFGTTYDDNVFATETDKKNDFLFQVLPSVAVSSDFNRHQINFSAGADLGRYVENTSENYLDYYVTGGGRYDVTGNSSISGNIAYRDLHEDRGDPDSPNSAIEPVDFTRTNADLSFQQRFNRLSGRVSLGIENENYDDVASITGQTLDQDDRDLWAYSPSAQIGYDLYPGYMPFLRFIYTRTEYEEGIVKPNSDTYEGQVGTTFDLTDLLTGEVFIGYRSRQYDEEVFDTTSGLSYGVALDYAFTQLTSFKIDVSTKTDEGFAQNPDPRERTTFSLGVNHELLRNLVLSAGAQYHFDDYQESDREEDFYLLQVGATYTLNRNLYLRGTYSYSNLDSNREGEDYDRNLFLLRIGAQL
jgi:hypothetical protein